MAETLKIHEKKIVKKYVKKFMKKIRDVVTNLRNFFFNWQTEKKCFEQIGYSFFQLRKIHGKNW